MVFHEEWWLDNCYHGGWSDWGAREAEMILSY